MINFNMNVLSKTPWEHLLRFSCSGGKRFFTQGFVGLGFSSGTPIP